MTLTEAKKLVIKAVQIQKQVKELDQIKKDLKEFAKKKKITIIKAGNKSAVFSDHTGPGKIDEELLKKHTTKKQYQSCLVPNLSLVRKLKLDQEEEIIKSKITGFGKITFIDGGE